MLGWVPLTREDIIFGRIPRHISWFYGSMVQTKSIIPHYTDTVSCFQEEDDDSPDQNALPVYSDQVVQDQTVHHFLLPHIFLFCYLIVYS